ncbi:MAG: UDP-glucose--hexose-1-phosphate uridylyltransferase [Catonella sp.]|uniref:UDP-glucose--hexose-1-phosphate uridylyltransferase n=1 Tax=Catonella sp. TaxID=2382125 RepID=UPI003FA010B4
MIYNAIDRLIAFGLAKGLLEENDVLYTRNKLLYTLGLSDYQGSGEVAECKEELAEILKDILKYAMEEGLVSDSITEQDLFDTKIMDCLLGRPSEIVAKFTALCRKSPKEATDWYYDFSKATNYIREDRIIKDVKWQADSPYGKLDITINLSKPEKDPKAIAAAKKLVQSGYPKCLLCRENEGFAGDMNKPARENHRIIPLTLGGENYFLQYSPYVYYNEHCIILNEGHVPMKIDRAVFLKLLEFTEKFPHYMAGSNADLPIVGGSILTHDHFQGGNYEFPMARAGLRTEVKFKGYEDIRAGVVNWPMSVIRLTGADYRKLAELADKILLLWRGYSDEEVDVYAESDGEPHNTITPIARRRGEDFEIDLVLRNNRTTEEFPLGIFHPHDKLHHIKKENIGLIEVMGLAVLPGRLKGEMDSLRTALLKGEDIRKDEVLAKHADWVDEFMARHKEFNEVNAEEIIRQEIGLVFSEVLTDAGVYKDDENGRKGILRFIERVNAL